MRRKDSHRAARQQGSALLVVLWVTVLLSMLLGTATLLVRSDAAQLRSARAFQNYRLSGSNALAHLQSRDINSLDLNDVPGNIVRISNASFLELINVGPILQIEAALMTTNDELVAKEATALIIDSRDVDSFISAYAVSVGIGAENGALNRPFLTLGEVARVTGIPLSDLKCIDESIPATSEQYSWRAGRLVALEIRQQNSQRSPLIVQMRNMGQPNRLSTVAIQSDRRTYQECETI